MCDEFAVVPRQFQTLPNYVWNNTSLCPPDRVYFALMPLNPPHIEIVAGPNGSGKTTFAQAYFINELRRKKYFNPDLIASGISSVDFERASFMAGRILIKEVKDHIRESKSFVMESTLSGKTWLKILSTAKKSGYKISIYFLFLEKTSLHVERIKNRVSLGGHNISTSTLKRRKPRVFKNFWSIYRPLCDEWTIMNNTGAAPLVTLDSRQFDMLESELQQKFIRYFLEGKPHGFKK